VNNSDPINDVVIIGGGPAGATAAIYTARAGLQTLVIDKGLTTSALGVASRIANYPGLAEPVSGTALLEGMRTQAKSFGAELIQDKVIDVDLQAEIKMVYGNNQDYAARAVVIATGSMGRGILVKGEGELLGKGVSYCATCDAAFYEGQEVAVAGSSDEAVEEALFLARFASKVHFICPTSRPHAPDPLVKELMENRGITFYGETSLREVIGEQEVEAALYMQKGQPEVIIPVSGAFIYLQGGRPITDFLNGQLDLSEGGCVVVDREFRTSIPGVYAVGDVLCNHIKQVVVAAGEGAIAGMAVEKLLRGRDRIIADWKK
jgi:thioredoxin reductase (NADPH)